MALLVLTANQSGPGGRAAGSIRICVSEAYSLACQAVEVRSSRIFHSVTAQVSVTQIVHEDEDDIWFSGSRIGLRHGSWERRSNEKNAYEEMAKKSRHTGYSECSAGGP